MIKRKSKLDGFMKAGKSPVLNWVKGHKRTVFTSIVVLIALCFTYDIYGPGGNIEFYSKWVECGQRPVITKGMGYFSADVVHYKEAPLFDSVRYHRSKDFPYYCTPKEAELEGFSAESNYYEFRHTTDQERADYYPRRLDSHK